MRDEIQGGVIAQMDLPELAHAAKSCAPSRRRATSVPAG
jgi:hypothetical protein